MIHYLSTVGWDVSEPSPSTLATRLTICRAVDTKLPSQSPLPCLKKKLQTKLVSFIIEAGVPWYFVTKIFWPNVRKNCSSDQEKLLKYANFWIYYFSLSQCELLSTKISWLSTVNYLGENCLAFKIFTSCVLSLFATGKA